MQPEPAHRTTKKRKRAPNERPPICFRPGDLRAELDARCDGTEAGYRAVVVRDLERYYALLKEVREFFHPLERLDDARYMMTNPDGLTTEQWEAVHRESAGMAEYYVLLDAYERAHILIQHAGLTVDHALVVVGLVKEEEG
jgi:hypothetical protein